LEFITTSLLRRISAAAELLLALYFGHSFRKLKLRNSTAENCCWRSILVMAL
jgi:hypothetical protein